LYADCSADMIKVWKAIIDTVGHYARPDVVRLQYLKTARPSLAEQAEQILDNSSPRELAATAEQHGVSPQDLETAIKHLAQAKG
jgi:nitrilase